MEIPFQHSKIFVILLLVNVAPILAQNEATNAFLGQLWTTVQSGLNGLLNSAVSGIQKSAEPEKTGNIRFVTGNNQLGSGSSAGAGIACPPCLTIDGQQLIGSWYQIYATDNFIKNSLLRLGQNQQTNAFNNLFTPEKQPICVRFDIGEPVSYGFMIDFPFMITYRLGIPAGDQVQIPARLRQTTPGKLILMVGTGPDQYLLRLCLIETNLDTKPLPTEPNTIGSFTNNLRPTGSFVNNPGSTGSFANNPGSAGTFANNPGSTGSFANNPGSTGSFANNPGPAGSFGINHTVRYVPRNRRDSTVWSPENSTFGIPVQPVTERISQTRDFNRSTTEQAMRPPSAFQVFTKYAIFMETGGFSGCQNYFVLTNDRTEYFQRLDNTVMGRLGQLNSDANPIQYIGCPQGYEDI